MSQIDRMMGRRAPADENGCVRWLGSTRPTGYGNISWKGRNVNAHRAFWELYNNATVPAGMVVRHTCDNPWCVSASHLVIGTPKQNTEDILSRGRWGFPRATGERHHKARLTEPQVLEIRAVNGKTNRQIADAYGVSQSAIAHIRARHTWKYIEEDRA